MAVSQIELDTDYNSYQSPPLGEQVDLESGVSYHSSEPGAAVSIINRVWDTTVGNFVTWTTAFVDNTGLRYPRGIAAFVSDATDYEIYEVSFSRPQ